MNSVTAFSRVNQEDDETVALQDLNAFLEQPHSIGIDNLKESLRNIVQLMQELKGYSTGQDLQHLLLGEHSSMSMGNELDYDDIKKKKIKQFWADMQEIERMAGQHLSEIKHHTVQYVAVVKQGIVAELAHIDAHIDATAATTDQAMRMKASHKKRRKLKRFKTHIEAHEIDLHESDNAQEVLEIQKNIVEDVQDFQENRFNAQKTRPDPLGTLGIMMSTPYRVRNDISYYTAKRSSTGKTGSGSRSTTDDTSGKGAGEDIALPPFIADF